MLRLAFVALVLVPTAAFAEWPVFGNVSGCNQYALYGTPIDDDGVIVTSDEVIFYEMTCALSGPLNASGEPVIAPCLGADGEEEMAMTVRLADGALHIDERPGDSLVQCQLREASSP